MKQNYRIKYISLILLYLTLAFALIFLILKFGVSTAVKISIFLQKDKNTPDTNMTENFLPFPQLNPIPAATNSAQLTISGYSQANQFVEIFLNNKSIRDANVNSEGKFECKIELDRGENVITSLTKDNQNNQSAFSPDWKILYNNQPPLIEILEPENNKLYKKYGFVEIKGKTDKTNKVYINDHLLIINNDGTFSYSIKLNEGENLFKIVCLDPMQNKTEKELTLRFQR